VDVLPFMIDGAGDAPPDAMLDSRGVLLFYSLFWFVLGIGLLNLQKRVYCETVGAVEAFSNIRRELVLGDLRADSA
jgi:hypothetical protein